MGILDNPALILGIIFGIVLGFTSIIRVTIEVISQMIHRDPKFVVRSFITALVSASVAYLWQGGVTFEVFVSGMLGFLLFVFYKTWSL